MTLGAAVGRKAGSKNKPKGEEQEAEPEPKRVRMTPGQRGTENRRFGTLARLAEDVVADAKVVASLRGISMAELMSDILRPILKKALTDELRKRVEG